MSLRIRFQYQTGSRLGYSIEQLGSGLFYDFSNSSFVSSPATLISPIPEDTGSFAGRYKATVSPTPAALFTDGDYVVTIHDLANSNNVVAELGASIHAGDDATVIPQPGASVVDPWTVSLPGSYATGSAGAILGTNLNAQVSTRSIYAGGPVASVTAPVTVGTNNDKMGYALASSGLDTITIEAGINLRQALSPILAQAAGVIAGMGSGVMVVKGANTNTTRITAVLDDAGDRSSVSLSMPV
jgi:hypothetical protein